MKKTSAMVVRLGARLAAQQANGAFKAWEECAFVEQLLIRVEKILVDLGLADHELGVRIAGPEEQGSKFFFGLELDNVKCHGPLDRNPDGRISAEQLAELATATLIAHRDTLLARAVRDEEWERALSTGLPQDWIPRPAFDDLLAAAIRHGLDVPKAIHGFVNLFKGGMRLDELADHVEAIIATQSAPVIRVHVGSMDGLEEESLSKSVRDRLFSETGVVFPQLKLILDKDLTANEFHLELNKLRTVVNGFEEARLADTLAKLLRNHAPAYITTTEIDSALGRLADNRLPLSFPIVVFNAIEAHGTVSVLRVLRQLVDEGVDIRDLRTILGAMLEANGTLPARYEGLAVVLPYEATFLAEVVSGEERTQTDRYVECVRSQLRDQICQASADSDRVLHVVRLPATLDTRLLRVDRDPLSEDETFELLSAIARVVETGQDGTVLLASSRNRRRLWEIIRHEFPQLPVLCETEISRYVKKIDVGELTLA